MSKKIAPMTWIPVLLMALAIGCSTKPPEVPATNGSNDEPAVRAKFAQLQAAIKNQDADKLWVLLDAKSQADAEREAKNIQTVYAKASAEEKANQEKALGLNATDIAGLTGAGFLKTKRFQKKHREIPEGNIEKIVIQGDNATVHFLEPDGDHEKLILIRHDAQWKVWLAMPKTIQP